MNLIGKIIVIGETNEYGANNFKKAEFVIETQEQYPQKVSFELHGENTELKHFVKVGDIVDVTFNIKGREWINPQGEARYFNMLLAWKIVKQQ